MKRQRVVKFVATLEVTREDWGVKVIHPSLGLVATGKTEDEALTKMDRELSQEVESGLIRGKLNFAKNPVFGFNAMGKSLGR